MRPNQLPRQNQHRTKISEARVVDRPHSALLPMRGSDIHIIVHPGTIRQDLHVTDCQLSTLLTLQRSKYNLGATFRAPTADLTVEKRHDVLG